MLSELGVSLSSSAIRQIWTITELFMKGASSIKGENLPCYQRNEIIITK